MNELESDADSRLFQAMSKPPLTYAEKLKDPRWQRLRLNVMDAAGWACVDCGETREELHVHHPIYYEGREPWEYSASTLRCLCSICHTLTHLEQAKVVEFAKRRMLRDAADKHWVHELAARGNVKFRAELDASNARAATQTASR